MNENEITIYLPTVVNNVNEEWGAVPITESAKHEQELMKTDEILLSWQSLSSAVIPLGSFIIHPVSGIRYTLAEPYYPQAKEGGAVFSYQPTFQHELMLLAKIPFLLYTAGSNGETLVESDWNFTGKGEDLMPSLVSAIYHGIGQTYTIEIDESIKAALILSFSNVDVLSALNAIAEQWDCEWYTDEQTEGVSTAGRTIHFAPRCLHLGGGSAAYPLTAGVNIEAPNSDNKSEFYNRFFVFGSTRNIPQDYQGAQANHVVNKRLTLSPTKYPNGYIDLPLFNENGEAQRDQSGNLIPADANPQRIFTKVLQFDDVYPKSNCRIRSFVKFAQFVTDSDGKKIALGDGSYDTWYVYVLWIEYKKQDNTWETFTINDSTYDKTNNPDGSKIKGLTVSIHFKTGALEGREFELSYNSQPKEYRDDITGIRHTVGAGSFEIKRIEDNTIILPSPNAEPKASTQNGVDNQGTTLWAHDGDEVIVFNIHMPQSYYNTAYEELEEKAVEEIYELSRDANQYTVKSNKVAFVSEQPNLTLGRRVALTFGGRTIDTRILKLSTHLDRPFEQEITLSKGLTKGTISTLLTSVESNAQKITQVSVKDDTQTKLAKQALYRSIQELNDSIFDTDGYFTDKINPLTVQTMMLKVGSASGNFSFEGVAFYPNYLGEYNKLYIECKTGAKLIHYGIGNYDQSYDHLLPVEWSMTGGTINIDNLTPVSSADNLWYLYAQCSRSSTGGSFLLSQEQKRYDSDLSGQWYYFLVGTLSSKQSNGTNTYIRILNTTYGQTSIDGSMLTTGIIKSITGGMEINLNTGEITGDITFTSSTANKINAIVDDNPTVAQASSDASAANTKATTANSNASAALTTAQTANSNAQQALNAANNITIGGRNLVLGTINPTSMTYPTTNYAQKWLYVSDALKIGSPAEDKYITASYKVDNWTEAYPPIHTIVLGKSDGTSGNWGTDGWSRRITFANSSYKQLTETTRLYSASQIIKTGDTNIGLTNNGTVGLITNASVRPSTAIPFSAYNIKVEFGTKATDWTPAPEDVEAAVAAAQAQADVAVADLANYASDSKISPTEKSALKQQWNDIQSQYEEVEANVTRYGLTSDSDWEQYEEAYDNVETAMNYFLAAGTWEQHISIGNGSVGATYYGYIGSYYDYLANVLMTIDYAAKGYVATKAAEVVSNAINLLSDSRIVDMSKSTYNSSTATKNSEVWDGIETYDTATSKKLIVTFPSLTSGAKYTFSFYYTRRWGSQTLKVDIGTNTSSVATVNDTTWRRFTMTFTASAGTTSAAIYINDTTARNVGFRRFQLEKGEEATPWGLSQDEIDAANAQRYLSDALAEASANVGGTTVNGGLVLSKFIGVRDSSDNVVAGMTATKDANGNKMPMIFAGAESSNQTLRLGKFQVWENGKIVSTNGTNEVHIDEDYIKFYNSGNLKNVITSAAGGGITAMSGKATTSDSTTIAPSYSDSNAGSFTQSSLQQEFVTKTIAAKVNTITLVSSPTKAGTINIAAGSIKFYTSSVWEYPITEVSGGAISIKLYSGATAIATLATGTLNAATKNVTLSWNAQNNIAFSAGAVLKLVISWNVWQVNLPTIDVDEGVSKPYSISRSYQAQGSIAISWALNEYKNTFYADGFFLSAASNKSFGVDPAMADTEQNLFRIQAPTTGTATQTFCMRPKGLGYSAGSSSLYYLNPLCLIMRVSWDNSTSKYSANILYNPRNVTPTVNTDGSNCKIFHDLGTIPVTVNVMLISNSRDNRRGGVQVYWGSNFVTVNVGDYSNSWRADFDIFFYDYSTL